MKTVYAYPGQETNYAWLKRMIYWTKTWRTRTRTKTSTTAGVQGRKHDEDTQQCEIYL